MPFAPNELRTAVGIDNISDCVNLIFNIKSHGHRVVGSMFAARHGNACINIGVNTIFIIACCNLDFFLFFLEGHNSHTEIIDYITVGHVRIFRSIPSRVAEIVLFQEHRQGQIFMRKRTHFIDKIAACLHIVKRRFGSRHRSPDAVVCDVHNRLYHQLIIAACELIKIHSDVI